MHPKSMKLLTEAKKSEWAVLYRGAIDMHINQQSGLTIHGRKRH
jgi:hypothetical protein